MLIGKKISHYKILEKLGEGGMGIVYKAQDTKLGRFVALKFLSPHLTTSEDNKQRFIHEAKAASALQHNNICAIHEINETEDGQIYISMDYYEGKTLQKKMSTTGDSPERQDIKLKIKEAVDYTLQIADGLRKAHEKEMVHRDIKPANIIITEDGVVKILDFGLAKLSNQTKLTKEGTTLGTIAYMSPEQTRGESIDQRADIWSLGVILYEMLTGKLPFKGNYDQAVIYSILNETHEALTELRTDVPAQLGKIVDKTLAKKLESRFEIIQGSSGLDAIAITDHNTVEAIDDIRQIARKKGLFVFPGIELSIVRITARGIGKNPFGIDTLHFKGEFVFIRIGEIQCRKLKRQ